MRTYLDHAATAPTRPEVAEQVARDMAEMAGGAGGRADGALANPAALHGSGRKAAGRLAEARGRIAAALGVDAHEVILTSGGTEADGLVVAGRALAVPGGVLAVSAVEHPAVLDSARTARARLGARLRILGVDGAGLVRPETAAAVVREARSAREAREAWEAPAGGGAAPPEGGGAARPESRGSARPESGGAAGPVALVSVMAANNETGAVQDLAGIVAAVREASGVPRPGRPGYVPVHCDAVAAVGRVPLDVHGWGLDAVSVSGHKLGAPVGVGALVARRDLELAAPMGGGRQERGLRSGTQDVVGARALALALELAVAEREAEAERLEGLRSRLLAGALAIPGAHATLPGGAPHLPGTAHLWFEGVSAEALLMALDMAGIDASAGSACHAGVSGPSHVLMAMGLGEEAARGTLRCTMGAGTSLDDVERLLAALPAAVGTARRAHRAH
ncbi:cysteine desulfurase family protein [Actinomyces marmotae]|uniref:cysteine desulfurase n=1 Tax=Actinomyces marmotae TaxID=2737173 RepID=A0A6M8B107_9ACTO|nr:aminotransferase class V-fold PLP-dependent enzyme [Actinomyces marmotae]QKD79422.1 aminotransferase class V-fold PLP-dependent enzyme [Actinomyces marmotae]